LTVTATQGTGGNIALTAQSGLLTIDQGATMSVDAGGAGFKGGTISISALGLRQLDTVTPVTFSANGTGDGDGGTISVATNSSAFDIVVGDDLSGTASRDSRQPADQVHH